MPITVKIANDWAVERARAAPSAGARKGALQGVDLLPAKMLHGKWIALQGELDQVCPAQPTQDFVAKVSGAEIVMLPKVGHGYSVERNWVAQFEAAYDRITAAKSAAAQQ